MHTRHPIGLLAGLVLLLSGLGGPARPAPAAAATCGTAWSVVPSPDAGSVDDELTGVSAISATDAWAVGFSVEATTRANRTLAEHWDGSAWTVVPSPNRANNGNNLRAIAAISRADLWAAGSSTTPLHVSNTLSEHWDGSAWKLVPSVDPDRLANSDLFGVAAVSARDVWAVGSYFAEGTDRTLIEHWNGSRWTLVPSPNLGQFNHLFAVDAVGANDVWAVGSTGDGLLEQPLVEHWDGSAWTVTPSPTLSPDENRLRAVSAVAADNVWAVGVTGLGTLVEHWDGARWSVVASRTPSSVAADLAGVAAVSATDIWAVGSYVDATTHVQRTLVEHWDGTQWAAVTTPNVPPGDNRLNAVAAIPAAQWAVGYAYAVTVPVGFTTFPGEIWAAPRSWVETVYPGLDYFNEVEKGGHFAAWEEPQLFSEEIRAAFRSLR